MHEMGIVRVERYLPPRPKHRDASPDHDVVVWEKGWRVFFQNGAQYLHTVASGAWTKIWGPLRDAPISHGEPE